jgi:hypothetical protein
MGAPGAPGAPGVPEVEKPSFMYKLMHWQEIKQKEVLAKQLEVETKLAAKKADLMAKRKAMEMNFLDKKDDMQLAVKAPVFWVLQHTAQ